MSGAASQTKVPTSSAAVLAVVVLLVTAAVAGVVLNPTGYRPWALAEQLSGPEDLSSAVSFGVSGALLLRYPSSRTVGLVLMMSGVTCSFGLLAAGIAHELSSAGAPGASPCWVLSVIGTTLTRYLAIIVLPQVFPNGLLPGRRWRLVLSATVLLYLVWLAVVGYILTQDQSRTAHATLAVLTGVAMMSGVVSLCVRWLRGSPLIRQQIGLLCVVLVLALTISGLLQLGLIPIGAAGTALEVIFPPAVVAAICVAVVQYRLWDIRFMIRRAAVFVVLTLILVLFAIVVYVLLLAAAWGLAADTTHRWMVMVAVFVVIIAAEPLRRRLQAALERHLLGDRRHPWTALARLNTAGAQREPSAVLNVIVDAVQEALRAPGVALAVQQGPITTVLAEVGALSQDAVGVPLVHRGERLGELRVSARTPGEAYGRADLSMLQQLAVQAAAIVYGWRRDGELVVARRSALEGIVEERSRIGRDLHDGIAPLLAGAGLTTEALRRRMPLGSADEQTASKLTDRLRAAATELRRVAHDLQPAAVERGIDAAVREHLASIQGPGVPTLSLHSTGADLPAAVANGAYLVILEAVANAVRHASARSVVIRLASDASDLDIVIDDDGTGLSEPYVAGLGITSMRQRVEALGGTFALANQPGGGTRLTARIPLR